MIFILKDGSPFVPPIGCMIKISFKHSLTYISDLLKDPSISVVWQPGPDLGMDDYELLVNYPKLTHDAIVNCSSNDLVIIPTGMRCYNITTFEINPLSNGFDKLANLIEKQQKLVDSLSDIFRLKPTDSLKKFIPHLVDVNKFQKQLDDDPEYR